MRFLSVVVALKPQAGLICYKWVRYLGQQKFLHSFSFLLENVWFHLVLALLEWAEGDDLGSIKSGQRGRGELAIGGRENSNEMC